MSDLGNSLLIFGIVLVVTGLLINFSNQIPLLGKLPGDIYVDKGNFKFFFPLTTSIIISLLLTLIVNFFKK